MPFDIWIAFTVASAVLLAIPGPTVMLVVSFALGRGRGTGWATVPGVTLGDFTAMTVSILGAGAILAASATLFAILKIAGAGYLVWLGIKLWRSKPQLNDIELAAGDQKRTTMFWNSYIVTALNRKSILLFVTFVPQFVDPAQPAFQQFLILEMTFLVLAAANAAIWVMLAGSLQSRFQRPRTLKVVNRIGASFLIGAGALTAATRRGAFLN